MMTSKDSLQRFLFEHLSIRGDIVQLQASWQAILANHDYPEPVRNLLGQMLVASVLLTATLKLKGRMSIQIQGSGSIPFLVVECSHERAIRGLAHFHDEIPQGNLKTLVGNGQMAITLEPDDGRERYQSIVELTGDTLADALAHYLHISEQLDTQLWLFSGTDSAGGLLIQKLPEQKTNLRSNHITPVDEDAWNRIEQLSSTIRAEEISKLDAREIMHRLYHEEDVRVFESEPVFFRCSCSKERVANMLRTLGYEEVTSIIRERDNVHVACEFCNHKYEFDAVDAEQLFIKGVSPDMPATQH